MINHSLRVMIFAWFSGSAFPICSTILHTPIPIVFFFKFPNTGIQCHFVKIRYTTRGPIARSIVYFNSPSCSLPYNNNPPYLRFPFIGKWYAYCRSLHQMRFMFFTITRKVFKIGVFNATNKVCNLVSIRVGPLYITSSWLSYSWHGFLYFGQIGEI